MTREDYSTCSQRRQRMAQWTRGCVLVGLIGLLVSAVISTQLYTSYQHPMLNTNSQRINPNTATVASLVRLPGIGRARALDIIHYRQKQQSEGLVFHSVQDLENIRGIGPKTAAKLSPWLTFETE